MSGRRSSSSSSSTRASEASSNLRDRINHLSQQTRQVDPNWQIDPVDSAIPFAERSPLTTSTEPLPEPADNPSRSTEDIARPIAAAEKKTTKLIDFDADAHRPLDIAATALSEDISVKPAFPTEVSELIGSPSHDDASDGNENGNENVNENMSATLSLRSLKKIPDDQLPAIYDLLPAIEASDDELDSFPHDRSSIASEQAVLFSFDIIESEEPVAELPFTVEQSSSALFLDARSGTSIGNELSDLELELSEAIQDSSTVKPLVPSAQILAEDEVRSKLPETTPVLQPAEELAEPESQIEHEAQELLFKPAQAAPFDSALADTAQSLSSARPPAETANEDSPVKNGVVKLLFTLKEGNFHGYVAPDDGTKDVLFHQKYVNTGIFFRLERGARVAVSVKYVEGKAYATHMELL